MRPFALFVVVALGAACADPAVSNLNVSPTLSADVALPLAPLVAPSVAFEDLNPDPNVVEVNLEAAEKVMPIGTRMVSMYTYNGQLPGPLLEAKPGDRVIVHFTNQLPEPTTIHWHGLRISDQMDGSPRLQAPVQPGGTFTYDFVVPEAGSFWYHPHVRANEQVEKGLYGPIVIRDGQQPRYDRERSLVLDDILLSGSTLAPFLATHMEQMHGRYGNMLLTNGKKSGEAFDVGRVGEIERWRIVNTANARTMKLKLVGAAFSVIATDGMLLPSPWSAETLELAVGQRLDLEVRYLDPNGVSLQSLVAVDDGQGGVTEAPVKIFHVAIGTPSLTAEEVRYPKMPEVTLPTRTPTRTIDVALEGMTDASGNLMWMINGKAHSMEPLFTAEKGETVTIHIVNKAGPEHPFHLHGQFFTVVGKPEQGLRDTWLIPGLSTVDLVASLDNPGRWMAHCHILEHSELGMMTEFVVNDTGH